MRKFIKDYLAKEYDNYVKDLEALTNIDSGNGDLEGTEAANKFVAAKMHALGAETEFRYNDRGCHLISRLKGKGTQTVLLVAHVDTVFKRGEAAKRPFRVDENGFAWGPGVGDDKATVMEVIYGLAALKKAGFDDYKEIIYYTNAEEEGGSLTAEGIVAELSQQADFAVIMDVARPNWGIVTQRKGNAKYKITVTGTSWQAPCPANRKILPLKHWRHAALWTVASSFRSTPLTWALSAAPTIKSALFPATLTAK